MLTLLALGVALAAPPTGSQGGPRGGSSNDSRDQAQRPAPPDQPAWETKLYAEPRFGAFAYASSGGGTTTGASVGAEAGLRYWQTHRRLPRWRGKARVAGAYVLSTGDTSGMDFRLGNFIGPYWKSVGLDTGPDLFWNQYSYGSTDLSGSLGLAWPLTAKAWTGDISGWVGVEPAWLVDETRRVDWSETTLPGFGHEFTYRAGVGLVISGLSLSVSYSYKITAGGEEHGLGVGVNI